MEKIIFACTDHKTDDKQTPLQFFSRLCLYWAGRQTPGFQPTIGQAR